jgi:hypothetical protein
MAKLNKGQAIDALMGRLANDAEVNDANPAHLRLLDRSEMLESAGRVISVNHMWLVDNINPRYTVDVVETAVQHIVRVWRDKVDSFENTDPTIQAERKAKHFVYNVNRMIGDAQATLKEQFETNPAYAFTMTSAVQAAANLEVASRAKLMLETHSADEVRAELTNNLRWSDGLRLSGSTCPMTNLVDRAKTIATMQLAGAAQLS